MLIFEEYLWAKKNKRNTKDIYYLNTLNHLTDSLVSMLEFTGKIPDTVNTAYLKLYALLNGSAGIGKFKDDKYYAYRNTYTGNLDAYGVGTESIGATPIADFSGIIGKDCAVLKNDYFSMPDISLFVTAKEMSEIKTSINFNVMYSRLKPILLASTEKQKNALINAVKDIYDGVDISVISSNIVDIIDGKQMTSIDLTDVSNIERVDSLTKLYDDTLRFFWSEHGHSLHANVKKERENVDETNSYNSVSLISPLVRLEMAQEFCEELNRIFPEDFDIDVKLSETWEVEEEKLQQTVDDLTADNEADNEDEGSEADDGAEI